jgi:RNA polymerase sigma-70 factor (ECF subfamily)
LLLRTVEGMSQAETAQALSITQKAVETRLYRARQQLSALLDEG